MSRSRRQKKKTRETAGHTPMNDPLPDAAAPAANIDGSEPSISEDVLGALQAERDALLDQLLRARAEFDNYRKRVSRESEALRQRAAEALVQDLLPAVDNLELALKYKDQDHAALSEGVAMVTRQFQDALGRHGVAAIESTGRPFDPTLHEALAQVPSECVPKDSVVQEFQRGYVLGGRVLRPSKVTVSAGAASGTETPDA